MFQELPLDTNVYNAISKVTELEEKVYAELKVLIFFIYLFIFATFLSKEALIIYFYFQRGNDFIKEMDQTSYNIELGLPDLLDYSQKLMG